MENEIVKNILGLLHDEEQDLLGGNFDGLSEITTAKEHLLKKLDFTTIDESTLTELSKALARNQRLLQAATDGVLSAKLVIRTLMNREQTLAYGKNGQRTLLSDGTSDLEKRL